MGTNRHNSINIPKGDVMTDNDAYFNLFIALLVVFIAGVGIATLEYLIR